MKYIKKIIALLIIFNIICFAQNTIKYDNTSLISNLDISRSNSDEIINDPVAYAIKVMNDMSPLFSPLGYNTAIGVYTIGAGFAMNGGGYILLETPGLAFDMLHGGLYKVGSSIGYDLIMEIIEHSVKSPKKICKKISKEMIAEGLDNYKEAYRIVKQYRKTKYLSKKDAYSFLKNRWGIFKLSIAREFYNQSINTDYNINKMVAKKSTIELMEIFEKKYQKFLGIEQKMPIIKSALFIKDISNILKEKQIGLYNYEPYLELINKVEAINSQILSEQNKLNGNKSTKSTIALIIDSSGSMSRNDPQDIRKEAIKLIVNQISSQDNLIIVDFDSRSRVLNPENYNNWNREQLVECINLIDSDGGTNIGIGLQKLQNFIQFNKIDINNGGVLLLTDGLGEYNNEVEWYGFNNFPIYTIGLVGEQNIELLTDISINSGGQYFKAKSASDIFSRFQDFYNSLTGGNRVVKHETHILQDEVKMNDYFVDSSIESYSVYVQYEGSTVDLILYPPDGNVINKFSENVKWIERETSIYALIDKPETGKWKYELIGTDIPAMGEKVQFEVNAKTSDMASYRLLIDSLYTDFETGNISLIMYSPFGKDRFDEFTSECFITTPSNKTIKINTKNDNKFNFHANDKGIYEVQYNFNAMINGEKIMRNLYKNIHIGKLHAGYFGKIINIKSNINIEGNLGSITGNKIAYKCYIYKDGEESYFAYGSIIKVNEYSCEIKLKYKHPLIEIEIGDKLQIDKKQLYREK